jgi:hypothetical protein
MKIKKIFNKKALLFLQRHKLFFVFATFGFYIMFLKGREVTLYSLITSLIISLILYVIADGLINQK